MQRVRHVLLLQFVLLFPLLNCGNNEPRGFATGAHQIAAVNQAARLVGIPDPARFQQQFNFHQALTSERWYAVDPAGNPDPLSGHLIFEPYLSDPLVPYPPNRYLFSFYRGGGIVLDGEIYANNIFVHAPFALTGFVRNPAPGGGRFEAQMVNYTPEDEAQGGIDGLALEVEWDHPLVRAANFDTFQPESIVNARLKKTDAPGTKP